jgi:hypothetical protein
MTNAQSTSGGVSIVESWSGHVTIRAPDTLTVDVPLNLPKECDVEVSDGFRGSYMNASGYRAHFQARTQPLSWRSPGELCLVGRCGGVRQSRRYRLCTVALHPLLPRQGSERPELPGLRAS